MTVLNDLISGRNNNLTLLRFCAATGVVYAHSFHTAAEPFRSFFGIGVGDWAVNIFFIVSGFLICRSWINKCNLIDFVWARFLRIYPALWVSNILFVFVLGGLITSLSYGEFITQTSTLNYLVRNSIMVTGSQMDLPNVFASGDFNIPLWTLTHELQMYILLAVLGLLGFAARPLIVLTISLFGLIIWSAALSGLIVCDDPDRFRFLYHFFLGASAYNLRNIIPIRKSVLVALLAILFGGSLLVPVSFVRVLLLAVCTPYLILYLAFVPAGKIRQFNRCGDYSYGIYIFAFPLQKTIQYLLPEISPTMHFIATMAVTLPLAMLSWHFLEEPALRAEQPKPLKKLAAMASKVPTFEVP